MSAVNLTFLIFQKVFPLRPLGPSEEPLSYEERRVYRRWELGSLAPISALVPALGYLWYLALKGACGLFHEETPGTLWLFRPAPIVWLCPALFLGIMTSAVPLIGAYRILLGEQYRRYKRCCGERVGFDGDRALSSMSHVVFAGVAGFFLAVGPSFALFTETGVEVRRPLSLGAKFYRYAQVRGVEHRAAFRAPNGKVVRRPHYLILFDDGTSWSDDGILLVPPRVAERVARLVSRRSGKVIAELP